MVVFGLTRTGKTVFISNMLYLIDQKYPNVSQLIFSMKDELELENFNVDIITGFDDPKFGVSWIFADKNNNQTIESTAAYIASALGLLDNGKRYIINYLTEIQKNRQKIPRRFENFLMGILNYLKKPENQYGESQGDIWQATKQRIEAFLGNKRFLDAVEGNEKMPEWFMQWLYGIGGRGRKIFLDLRKFNIHEKRFLVLAIFQMIRAYSEPSRDKQLKRLFICDEAHILFYKPKTQDFYDSDNIGQYQIDSQLERIINELANTGTGAIFADQNPFKMLDSIRNQVGTRVFFRISQESAGLFTQDPKFQRFLSFLPDHTCWFESGPASVEFFMKPFPPLFQSQRKKLPNWSDYNKKVPGFESESKNNRNLSNSQESSGSLYLSDSPTYEKSTESIYP